MSDTTAILSTGTIILGFLGGIAGNYFAHNLETKENRTTLWASLFYILIILAPFFAILLTRDISQNETVFFTVIGVIFAVIGSVMSNVFVNFYYRVKKLPKEEKCNFRNGTVIMTVLFGFELLAMLVWLLWLFHKVSA
jgi:amino acid permease